MDLDPSVADTLALVGCVVAVLALLLAAAAWLRLSRLRRDYAVLQGPDGTTGSFVEAVAQKTAEVERLRGELRTLSGHVDRTAEDLRDSLRHVAVVRFDAFGDMGGRLSFAVALLDDAGDGVVLTSINGRAETRTYAKGIKAGASDQMLSPEEQQAVGYALRGAAR